MHPLYLLVAYLKRTKLQNFLDRRAFFQPGGFYSGGKGQNLLACSPTTVQIRQQRHPRLICFFWPKSFVVSFLFSWMACKHVLGNVNTGM
jgi:hypothetical protein